MKLYTEEQVKNFLKERTFIREETIDAMCDTLTPIELPSDEEISKIALEKPLNISSSWFNFVEGAMWLKEQIKQQG